MGNYSQHYFKVGDYLDACLISAEPALIASSSWESLASTIVYSSDTSMQYGTISKGKLVVKEGKHLKSANISAQFVDAIRHLGNR